MEGKKVIAICQFGGEFETNKDGTLSYKGGEAHAIDIDHGTVFEDLKSEIADLRNSGSGLMSIKYFLPGNRKTLITISNDRELKRMIDFNRDSVMVDVFVTMEGIVGHEHSNMPASRSSRTTLSEAAVPPDVIPSNAGNENGVHTQNEGIVDTPTGDAPSDVPVDSAPPVLEHLVSCVVKDYDHPSSWENAITGVRQRFRSANEFREALRRYAIAHKFAYKFKKNDSQRVTVNCKSENCPWRIHASRLLTTQFFCIKRMNSTHTCDGGVVTSASHATTNWLAGVIKEKLRSSPNYKPKDMVVDIKQEYGIELSYYQAWRGKEIAREQLRGTYEESLSQLPFLCEKILETNPGSFADFTTKDDSTFHRLFISFHASLHGFELGCRPLLFLDSISLKSKYQATLLAATAVDGDDGVFPVAFAVVDSETVDNWHWFLMELKTAVSTSQPITFVADVDKGLRESISQVFENGFHAYCLRYLSESFRRDLPTQFSQEVKRMLVGDFYSAAYAPREEEFERSLESIRGISPEAYEWTVHSKPEHWANALFGGARYNHTTSNFGEMFYSGVSEAYELPITQLVYTLRDKMMELIYKRGVDSSQWLTRLTPSMEEKLNKEILKAQALEASYIPGTDNIFDVRGNSIETVDIDQCICSCKGWQLTGLPCCHAIAIFNCIGRNPYDYCSRYFTTESYRLTYSKTINPVPDVNRTIQKDSSQGTVIVKPPPTRRPPGKSKRNRNAALGSEKRKRQRVKSKGTGQKKLTCKEAVK